MKKHVLPLVGCVSLLLLGGRAGHAQSVTLASLLTPGATIVSGDKLFSNFTYNSVGADMPTTANILVTPDTVGGNFGLLFNALWHANPSNTGETSFLSYTVTVLTPGAFITDIHLDGDPIVNGGIGSASVTEQVSDVITHTAVTSRPLSIFDIATNGGHTTQQNDELSTLSPLTSVNVSKTFSLSSDSGTTTAQITHTDQTYSQTFAAPEPGSLALLAGAMSPVLGLVLRRRSKKKLSLSMM